MRLEDAFCEIAVTLLFLGFSAAYGQTITTGDITGTVKDSSGAIVPAATVLLKAVDTGESRTATVNASGEYRFTTLRPGNYQISADSPGLKSDTGAVLISVGQVATVDLVLKPQSFHASDYGYRDSPAASERECQPCDLPLIPTS